MNKYFILALVFSWIACIAGGYKFGTDHAAAKQDAIDKKETIAVHDDAVRGVKDSASYEVIHAAVEAKLNSLMPKVEVPNAKSKTAAAPVCRVPVDVMQSISAAVSSRSPG